MGDSDPVGVGGGGGAGVGIAVSPVSDEPSVSQLSPGCIATCIADVVGVGPVGVVDTEGINEGGTTTRGL